MSLMPNPTVDQRTPAAETKVSPRLWVCIDPELRLAAVMRRSRQIFQPKLVNRIGRSLTFGSRRGVSRHGVSRAPGPQCRVWMAPALQAQIQ